MVAGFNDGIVVSARGMIGFEEKIRKDTPGRGRGRAGEANGR